MLILPVNQFFLFRVGLIRVGKPTVCVIELAFLDGKNYKRVPRAGILEIRLGEVCAAVGVRVIDAHQVHLAAACFAVSLEQIFGPQFVVRSLRTGRRVFERHGRHHAFLAVTDASQQGPAAFVGVSGAGMFHHLLPGLRFNLNHSSSQNCSLRYLSALSQKMVTITAVCTASYSSRPRRSAATTLAPDEIPTSSPSP